MGDPCIGLVGLFTRQFCCHGQCVGSLAGTPPSKHPKGVPSWNFSGVMMGLKKATNLFSPSNQKD